MREETIRARKAGLIYSDPDILDTGQILFQYRDENDELQTLESEDVNDYL